MEDINIPIPILCSIVMPDGFLVKSLALGTKMRSYIGTKRTMERLIKARSDAAGMSKPDHTDLSMVIPCLVKKVDDCANAIAYTKHVDHMGNSLRTDFASSTSLTLHAFPSSSKQVCTSKALFRNLPQQKLSQNPILNELQSNG